MTRTETFQVTPIPIETAYFLNDAAKFKTEKGYQLMRDSNKFNRYYFNYPPEWKTSNMGEGIVGVRSLWTMNRPREFSFIIYIRKYKKVKFFDALRNYSDKYKDKSNRELFLTSLSDNEIQKVINTMDAKDVIVFPFNVNIKMQTQDSFMDLWNIINEILTTKTDLKTFQKSYYMNSNNYTIEQKLKFIQALNKYDSDELLFQYNRDLWFKQSLDQSNKDISMFETITQPNELKEIFYSPHNLVLQDPYYVDILFLHNPNTYYKKYQNNANLIDDKLDSNLPPFFAQNVYSPYSRSDPQPLTSDDEFNKDFNAIFNAGKENWQNHLDYITSFHRLLSFKNVYNRGTLKIHASFGNPSNDYYVGNSHVYFTPIKYYKLNSKDDKFWIEFYSSHYHDCPVNIPEDEGFVLEMLFMQNQKLLYI